MFQIKNTTEGFYAFLAISRVSLNKSFESFSQNIETYTEVYQTDAKCQRNRQNERGREEEKGKRVVEKYENQFAIHGYCSFYLSIGAAG